MTSLAHPDGRWRFGVLACVVLDGDTVRLTLDLGFGIAGTIDLCLRGLDAPEHTPCHNNALLFVILIDAGTGILWAMRQTTLGTTFTAQLEEVIRQQASRPWPGDDAFDQQLSTLYSRYRQSAGLLSLATARTRAGS